MTIKKYSLIITMTVITLLSGCSILKKSVISVHDDFNEHSTVKSVEKDSRKIGFVANKNLGMVTAKSMAQLNGLTYDFEFNIGQDVIETLPNYLSETNNVIVIDQFSDQEDLDFVLNPTLTNSLVILIKESAAPRYNLKIGLDLAVFKAGRMQGVLSSTKESFVEIPAFENTDKLRDTIMKAEYKKQLAAIYEEIAEQLNQRLKAK